MMRELFFSSKSEWRDWLSSNSEDSEAVWLLFYKKKSGKPTLSYDDAVEQALCFGWIDGIVKGIDSIRFKRKFMPRKNLYNWSDSNRKRVEKLVAKDEMTEAGLKKIGDYASTRKLVWPIQEIDEPRAFTEDLHQLLQANQQAMANFQNLTDSHQKKYISWVMSAKKLETRRNRMNEAIKLLYNNRKNLMK